jgi:hypothetical protein
VQHFAASAQVSLVAHTARAPSPEGLPCSETGPVTRLDIRRARRLNTGGGASSSPRERDRSGCGYRQFMTDFNCGALNVRMCAGVAGLVALLHQLDRAPAARRTPVE